MGDIGLLALATANAYNAYEMARLQLKLLRKQRTLAERYQEFYQIQRQFYRDVFQFNVEERILAATLSTTFTPNYRAQYGTAQVFGNDRIDRYSQLITGRGAPDPKDSYYARRGQMYSLPGFIDVQLHNYLSLHIVAHRVDAITHLYRYEEYKETIYQQRRFERFSAVAEYSNKVAVNLAQEGSSSFAYLNNALEAKGNHYGAASNDLFAAAGNAYQSGSAKKMDNSFNIQKRQKTVPEQYSANQEKSISSPTWNSPRNGPIIK